MSILKRRKMKSDTNLLSHEHAHGSNANDITKENSLKFIIKLQQALIHDYKTQLNLANDEITHCKENFDYIRETNDFDAENLTNVLIRHARNQSDKEVFRNAIMFMQHRLNTILETIETDDNYKHI